MTSSPDQLPFSSRSPSTAWESAAVPGMPELQVAVWFRPATLPNGAAVAVTAELLSGCSDRSALTLRRITEAAGFSPAEIMGVSVYGHQWVPGPALPAILDLPVPDPPASEAAQILIASGHTAGGAVAPVQPYGSVPSAMPGHTPGGTTPGGTTPAFSGDTKQLQDRIDADWQTCLQTERQLSGLRQKLSTALGKLGSLDRELTPQERMAADREDTDAWQDARRFIRDASAKVHRFIKAHDVGVTSDAGRRTLIEQLHQRCMAGTLSPAEVSELYREMETYRRLLSQLQTNMNSAAASASQDGEGRARRVLQRINVKIQQQRRQWRSGK